MLPLERGAALRLREEDFEGLDTLLLDLLERLGLMLDDFFFEPPLEILIGFEEDLLLELRDGFDTLLLLLRDGFRMLPLVLRLEEDDRPIFLLPELLLLPLITRPRLDLLVLSVPRATVRRSLPVELLRWISLIRLVRSIFLGLPTVRRVPRSIPLPSIRLVC